MHIKAKIIGPDESKIYKLSGEIDLSQVEFIKESESEHNTKDDDVLFSSEMEEYIKWFKTRFPGGHICVRQEFITLFHYAKRLASYPKECPITGRPFFAEIEKDGELVPTYGGPFDSYTIPIADEEIQEGEEEIGYTTTRYCHDDGGWKDDEWFTVEKD